MQAGWARTRAGVNLATVPRSISCKRTPAQLAAREEVSKSKSQLKTIG
jgi:hypothetical protein